MNNASSVGSEVRKARVLLVEDHPVVARGLAMLIDEEPDLAVCGTAASAAQAIAAVAEFRPDVVIIDISLGEDSGLELIKALHEAHPKLPLLTLSMHDENLYAERALRAGASGYVMKREVMDRVMAAIRRVLVGEVYISDKLASRMVNKLLDRGAASGASALETLSDREFEVFRLIAESVGPTEIAGRLGLSVKTVETHREHIKQKLALRSAAELNRFALEWSMRQK